MVAVTLLTLAPWVERDRWFEVIDVAQRSRNVSGVPSSLVKDILDRVRYCKTI
jgi:hypothetical protein